MNARNTQPSSTLERWNSSWMKCPAIEILTRSRYAIALMTNIQKMRTHRTRPQTMPAIVDTFPRTSRPLTGSVTRRHSVRMGTGCRHQRNGGPPGNLKGLGVVLACRFLHLPNGACQQGLNGIHTDIQRRRDLGVTHGLGTHLQDFGFATGQYGKKTLNFDLGIRGSVRRCGCG